MKNYLLVLFAIIQLRLIAQDVIYFHNNTQQLAKVMEVNQNEIVYKKASNPDGPVYRINKSDVSSIAYENGGRDLFNTSPATNTSIAAPAPQQPAAQQGSPNTVIQYYPTPSPRPNIVVQLGAPIYTPPVFVGGVFNYGYGFGNYYGGYGHPHGHHYYPNHYNRPRCIW